MAAMIRAIPNAMLDEHGFNQQGVAINLHYLLQMAWCVR